MDENMRVVEINGVKIEVDLRNCKVIENYKVGDAVKVLVKKYSSYESYAGVIIGFDDFKERPTIIVAYLESSYSTAEIKFVYINADTKDVEICPSVKMDKFLDKSHALGLLDNSIEKKKIELQELETKKRLFEKEFEVYFQDLKV